MLVQQFDQHQTNTNHHKPALTGMEIHASSSVGFKVYSRDSRLCNNAERERCWFLQMFVSKNLLKCKHNEIMVIPIGLAI